MTRGEMSWSGWGHADDRVSLDSSLRTLLHTALGVKRATPAVPEGELRLPASRLTAKARAGLAALLGEENVHTDRASRIAHTRGKSTSDLLRIRSGDLNDAPDAVLTPGSHREVVAVLEACAAQQTAVVPFGGGTSVVGGLAPGRARSDAVVALDLRRLNRLLELDEISRTATLEPGLLGPAAEQLLAARGYTLGHRPQSFHFGSVGGFAATRSSGEASTGYGRFDERVVGLRVATSRGTIELGRAPKSAAGPDLRQLFLGSEGRFGVITAVRVEVSPLPEARIYDGWRFASFGQGLEALRTLAQDGPTPAVLRLADETETALTHGETGSLAITGLEGGAREVHERRAQIAAMLSERARPDSAAAENWLRERYRAPYLRDALLDAGALVETIETATFWAGIAGLYEQVRRALSETLEQLGTPPVILCHISHVYPSGASLYFTIAAAQLEDPVAQWRTAKTAASDAILQANGTITHHHGVGADHRDHYGRELGPLAVQILESVRSTVDPEGILNPGVLIPAGEGTG